MDAPLNVHVSRADLYRAMPQILGEAARLAPRRESDEYIVVIQMDPAHLTAAIVALSRFAIAIADGDADKAQALLQIYARHAQAMVKHLIEEEEKQQDGSGSGQRHALSVPPGRPPGSCPQRL